MINDVSIFVRELEGLSHYLKGFAYRLTQDVHQAEDLYQETALLAYKNREKYKIDGNLKAWLGTIMRNTFINQVRKKQRRISIQPLEEVLEPKERYTGNLGEKSLEYKELMRLIDELGEDFKTAFLMAYEGYSYQEISEQLGVALGTIKSRIYTARQHVQKRLAMIHQQEAYLLPA